MSKRFPIVFCVLLMMFMLVACGSGGGSSSTPSAPSTSSPSTPTPTPSTSNSNTTPAQTTTPAAPARSKIVAMAGNNRPTTLDPTVLANATDTYHIEMYMEALVFTDHSGVGWDPMLATSWERNDDASVWTFKLREGVSFHNGEAFDADDVVCTFEHFLSVKDTSRVFLSNIPDLTYVKKIDQYTIELGFSKPYPLALRGIGAIRIFPNEAYEELGPEELFRWWHSYGTGPWILNEYLDGQHTSFLKNENYWNKEKYDSYFEEARLIHSNEPSSNVAAHLAGDINAYGPSATMNFDLVPLYDSVKDRVEVLYVTTSSTNYLICQLGDHSPVKDMNLRQAISLAIDRELIYKSLFGSLGSPAVGFFHPTVPEYDPNDHTYKYDIELAKEYLAKSSYKGETLSCMCAASTTTEVTQALAVADMLAKIGIIMEVQPLDSMTRSTRSADGDFDLNYAGSPMSNGLPAAFFSSIITSASQRGHNDPVMFDLINSYNLAVDDKTRVEFGRKVGNRMTETLAPYIAIGYPPSIWARDYGITGVNFYPDGVTNFTYVNWDPSYTSTSGTSAPTVTNIFRVN